MKQGLLRTQHTHRMHFRALNQTTLSVPVCIRCTPGAQANPQVMQLVLYVPQQGPKWDEQQQLGDVLWNHNPKSNWNALCHHHFSSATSSHLLTIQSSGKASLLPPPTHRCFIPLPEAPSLVISEWMVVTRRTNCILYYIIFFIIPISLLGPSALAFRATLMQSAHITLFPNTLGLVPFSATANQPCQQQRLPYSVGPTGRSFLYISTLNYLPGEMNKWTRLINCTLLTDHITKPSFSDISCLLYCYCAGNEKKKDKKKRYCLLFSIPFFALVLTISLDGLQVMQGINRAGMSHQASLIPAVLIKCSYFV